MRDTYYVPTAEDHRIWKREAELVFEEFRQTSSTTLKRVVAELFPELKVVEDETNKPTVTWDGELASDPVVFFKLTRQTHTFSDLFLGRHPTGSREVAAVTITGDRGHISRWFTFTAPATPYFFDRKPQLSISGNAVHSSADLRDEAFEEKMRESLSDLEFRKNGHFRYRSRKAPHLSNE